MASVLSLLMLVTLLMPLFPPTAKAEGSGIIDWSSLLSTAKANPIPLVVLDFANRSTYKTGMLGREVTDALSLALQDTGKYAVVPRNDVDSVMHDASLTVPIDAGAQVMVADRLNAPFIISGEIENVGILRTKDGTCAEVTVNAVVLSKITRLPINGARVIQRSSPKIAYVGNPDALVYEALSTAAYQITQRILDHRIPVVSVLASAVSGEVHLRGGTVNGIQVGMRLVAVRNESVTGILRVEKTSPTDAECVVIDDRKGVAPGDKVVPVYSLERQQVSVVDAKKRSSGQMLSLVSLGLLGAILGSVANSSKTGATSGLAAAAPLADAVTTDRPSGANIVTWSRFSNAGNVLKYVIFRHTDGTGELPIAIVDGGVTSYVDVANPDLSNSDPTKAPWLYFLRSYSFTIRPQDGSLLSDSDLDTFGNASATLTWTYTETTFTAVLQDYPIATGQSVYYRVRPIYRVYTNITATSTDTGTSTNPNPYTWHIRLGEFSNATHVSAPLHPPTIVWPTTSIDGYYRCTRVLKGNVYALQLSNYLTFPKDHTETIQATMTTDSTTGAPVAEAYYSYDDLAFNSKFENAGTIYARMGVRSTDFDNPLAERVKYYDGYVYSLPSILTIPRTMLLRQGLRTNIIQTHSPNRGVPSGSNSRRRTQ
jgi:hypothetical protein